MADYQDEGKRILEEEAGDYATTFPLGAAGKRIGSAYKAAGGHSEN
jgi:hypothetical protein